jgi:hypothetical protein
MATITELERLDREVKDAEHRALANLAEHLRGAVRDMPSESKLARVFVRQAREFDYLATARHLSSTSASIELDRIAEELRTGARGNVLLGIADAMRAGAEQLPPDDRLGRALEKEADKLERRMS